MNKLMFLLIILIFTACGSDEAKEGSCQDKGLSIFVNFESENKSESVCINTNNIYIDKYNDKVLGVAGISNDSKAFLITRDGDYSDGNFNSEGEYNMGTYPYNLKVSIWDLKYSSCEEASMNNSNCIEYIGLSGEWSISSVSPFIASIKADKIVLDEDSDYIACADSSCGKITGRWSVQNR